MRMAIHEADVAAGERRNLAVAADHADAIAAGTVGNVDEAVRSNRDTVRIHELRPLTIAVAQPRWYRCRQARRPTTANPGRSARGLDRCPTKIRRSPVPLRWYASQPRRPRRARETGARFASVRRLVDRFSGVTCGSSTGGSLPHVSTR